MQEVLEKVGTSKTNYPLQNCGEFNAINNALLDGVDVKNLVVQSVNKQTGAIKPPCINCQELYGELVKFLN
ncbi:hypothetical protein A5881_001972 [Enterococcus termitis]|nr:hypothetical protein A5881_001711 [Enterococcus termitis]